MVDQVSRFLFAVSVSIMAWWAVQHAPQRVDPAPIVYPTPHPTPPPHKPLLPWHRGAKVGGDVAPDGTPVQVDLPQELRMQNTGGSDGAGLCVFTSINHSALWQDVKILQDFQSWMRGRPGGGYPDKVDRMITKKCKEAGAPVPQYIQVEGEDLDIIELACRTGRMPACTYGYSPSGRYGGQRISHMISVVHADGKYVAVLDNNYIRELEWLTKSEFAKTHNADGAWTVILLAPSPPPTPRNR